MFRLKQSVKLASVVWLSTLLLLMTASSMVSQAAATSQLPSRQDITQALGDQFNTLTAGTAPLLLTDQALFLSDPSGTMAAVPRETREFKAKLAPFIAGNTDSATFGGLVVSGSMTVMDVDNKPVKLAPGSYTIKLARTPQLVAQFVNDAGEVALTVPASLQLKGATNSASSITPSVLDSGSIEAGNRVHRLTFSFPPIQLTQAEASSFGVGGLKGGVFRPAVPKNTLLYIAAALLVVAFVLVVIAANQKN